MIDETLLMEFGGSRDLDEKYAPVIKSFKLPSGPALTVPAPPTIFSKAWWRAKWNAPSKLPPWLQFAFPFNIVSLGFWTFLMFALDSPTSVSFLSGRVDSVTHTLPSLPDSRHHQLHLQRLSLAAPDQAARVQRPE